MHFTIDSSITTPPFEQVRRYVLGATRSGELPPGTKLPTVRALADTLGLATNTVARAYRELERDEVIETRGRLGSFVAASGDSTHRAAHNAALAYADRVTKLGLEREEALEIVSMALSTRA